MYSLKYLHGECKERHPISFWLLNVEREDDMTLIIKEQQQKTITDIMVHSLIYLPIDGLEFSFSTKHFLAYITMIIKTVCTHSIVKKKEQYSETQEDTGELGHDIKNEGCYKKILQSF